MRRLLNQLTLAGMACLWSFQVTAKPIKIPPILIDAKEDPAKKAYFCKVYTNVSLAFQEKIAVHNCGMKGADVNRNYNELYNSCLKVPMATSKHRLKTLVAKEKQCHIKNCQSYVKLTTLQQTLNNTFKCKLAGPRWTYSSSQLYNWCMSASEHDIQSNRSNQTYLLKKCAQNKTAYCKIYTKDIMTNINWMYLCGQPHPDQGKTSPKIMNECLKEDSNVLYGKKHKAAVQGNVCKASKKKQCEEYVTFVVNAQKTNLKNLCGYKGYTWQTTNTSFLLDRCYKATYKLISNEQQDMKQKLTLCISKQVKN